MIELDAVRAALESTQADLALEREKSRVLLAQVRSLENELRTYSREHLKLYRRFHKPGPKPLKKTEGPTC